MDLKSLKPIPKNKDVVPFKKELRFQLETKGKSRDKGPSDWLLELKGVVRVFTNHHTFNVGEKFYL